MSALRSVPLLRAAIFITGLLLLSAPRQADALSRIRREVWSYQANVPLAPGETVVDVSFFATVGDMEQATRVMFSVDLVDEMQQRHTLIRYQWGEWNWIPSYGTRGQVFISFTLTCDDDGYIRARPLDINFRFCSFAQTDPQPGGLDEFESFAVRPGGNFGLVLVARGGRPGDTPTPMGVFACSDDVGGGLNATAALERLKRRNNARINATPEFEPSGSIGIYFDPLGTQCSGRLEPGVVGRVYVVAKLGGMIECGISGAEFRFTGIPDDWIVHAVPNSDFVAIGNPLRQGAALGFTCERPKGGTVVLYTVDLFPSELVEDLRFEIESRDPSSSPEAPCAHVVLCDRPMFTKFCVEGRTCLVNATQESPACDSATAVTTSSWSAVKSVFR